MLFLVFFLASPAVLTNPRRQTNVRHHRHRRARVRPSFSSDEEVRQGLKEYSNWPTYPQLYVGGELMGGCDIVLEMAAGGELKGALAGATA